MFNNEDIETFPATEGNEITYTSYCFIKGQIVRGTLKAAVCKVKHQKGRIEYETYHLISKRG